MQSTVYFGGLGGCPQSCGMGLVAVGMEADGRQRGWAPSIPPSMLIARMLMDDAMVYPMATPTRLAYWMMPQKVTLAHSRLLTSPPTRQDVVKLSGYGTDMAE